MWSTCSRFIATEFGSALTWHATSSWAVELATCLADDISFSSVAWPCTSALAASHRFLVAAATSRAYVNVNNDNNNNNNNNLSLSLSLSLAIFPGEPGLAEFTRTKDDGSGEW